MNKHYVVFSRQMARKLRKNGFEQIGIDRNKKRPDHAVYLFIDTPELRSAIETLSRKTHQNCSQQLKIYYSEQF